MATILCIETSTAICSVALARNKEVVAIHESHIANTHSELVSVFIEKIIKGLPDGFTGVDAVAVSMGPGSYTGLRIGVSAAKGLCYAAGIPLISVGTLLAMANGMKQTTGIENENTLLCPMIDAKRMEVYCALYDLQLTEILPTRAEIIDNNSFSDFLNNNSLLFFGDGMDKCKTLLQKNPNAHFIDRFLASAKYMMDEAFKKLQEKQFEDVAYFEPFYLKDFIAGKPNVKGLK